MDLNYTVKLHTYWHCGSGLAAGSDVDALVIKDAQGLPFIPGKTLKGLFREAVEEILFFRSQGQDDGKLLCLIFGAKDNKGTGCAFFSNATLSSEEQSYIVDNKLTSYMYRSISNTAIDVDGVAKNSSLRKTEVVVPCVLHASIKDVPEDAVSLLDDALAYVKSLGVGRNRGLGRCTIEREGGER